MLNDIFNTLLESQRANQIALDRTGRQAECYLGVVTVNDDPKGLRRIKVSSDSLPGLDSYWVRRLAIMPGLDAPMPILGQTVVILSVAGDPNNTWYLSAINLTNAPIPGKEDPVKDLYQIIPGNETKEVSDTSKTTTGENLEFVAGKSIKFKTESGAYLELNEMGYVELADAYGHKIRLGSSGNNNVVEWNMNGDALRFVNASDFQISTNTSGLKTIATVGALDSDGDTLTSSGWK